MYIPVLQLEWSITGEKILVDGEDKLESNCNIKGRGGGGGVMDKDRVGVWVGNRGRVCSIGRMHSMHLC